MSEGGDRFYLKKRAPLAGGEEHKAPPPPSSREGGGLCGVPYHSLLEEALLEQERIGAGALMAVEEEASGDSGVESEEGEGPALWVDKYRPRSFVELLSDDGTNRVLLHWLKLWDRAVFGREKKKSRLAAKRAAEQESNKFEDQKGGGGRFGKDGQQQGAKKQVRETIRRPSSSNLNFNLPHLV